MCDSWFLNWAPCPPFFIDEVYVVYITFATKQNLTECEIQTIRDKCGIDIPTTTTTTTTSTTTTTPSTTTTSTSPPTTEVFNITTTHSTSGGVSTSGPSSDTTPSSETSDTVTASTLDSQINGSTPSGTTNYSSSLVPSTNGSSLSNFTTFQTSRSPTSDLNDTINNITEVPVGAASSGEAFCRGVCLIVVSTTVACIAIVLLAVVAILLRKVKEGGKRDRDRSRSRSRNRYSEVPNTELYDSVDLPSYSNRSSGSEMWHDSSDYSLRSVLRHDPSDTSLKEHTFVNPAFRRSFEPPSRSSVFWYDPDAADPDHLHRNANLTRCSRTLDRKSPPKAVLNNQKDANKFRARSRSANHVSLREYVPKAVQYVDNFEQLPYQNLNGTVKKDVREIREIRGKSPSKRSLPRTMIDANPNTIQDSMSPKQRPSYRRSRSYDLDSPKQPKSRDEDGFYTVDTRHSRKHYIKNSQRNKQNGQTGRDRSVKGKLHRQSEGDSDEVFLNPNPTLGPIQRLSNQSLNSPDHRVLSSNLRPGSYKFRSQQAFLTDQESDDVFTKHGQHGRSRSHRELRERSPSIHVRRGRDTGSSFRPQPSDQIFIFQTKL